MALSCIICKIKRYIGAKSRFFHTSCIRHPVRWSPSEYCHIVWYRKKLGRCGYPRVEKFNDMYNRFDRIPACDRQMDRQKDKWTDRQTSCHAIVRAMHRRRAVKVEIFMTDL